MRISDWIRRVLFRSPSYFLIPVALPMGKPAELVVLHRRRIRAVRFPNPCAAFSLSWTTRSAFHYRLLCCTDSGMIANMRLLKAARIVLGWSQEEFSEKRSEEHTSELHPLMRISHACFRLQKKKNT